MVHPAIGVAALPAPITSCPPFAVDHHRAPILETLRLAHEAPLLHFATPGHKQGRGADPELHELIGSKVLASEVWLGADGYDRALRAAEELGAAAWGADRTFYLVNGSSSGNQAFLLATLGPGDEVIVGRNLHKSLLNALILTGAQPVYVAPRLHPDLQIGLGIAAEDVAAALEAHPAAKLVTLVSPTYWGVCSDLRAIADVAHAHGVPVYVDEAWGAHFHFHPALPPSGMASGVDGVVTSTHKLLTGLNQAGVLHVQGPRVDVDRLASTVQMTQTTSPSLPIVASIDACRRQMALHGESLLERSIELAGEARRQLLSVRGLSVLDADRLGIESCRYDATRLVIDVHGLGMMGCEVERALRGRFGIAVEMSDLVSVICLITVGDTPESVARLVTAFTALAEERTGGVGFSVAMHLRSSGAVIAPAPQALSPREAFFTRSRTVGLAEAVGQVAAELVVPYPPGIPVLTPGEVITAAKVEYLRDTRRYGMHIASAADPSLATLRVTNTADSPGSKALRCEPTLVSAGNNGASSVRDPVPEAGSPHVVALSSWDQWQPKDYLAEYYRTVDPDEIEVLAFLRDVLKDRRDIRVALEFGCGPTVHHLFPVAPHVTEIHLADYLPTNLDEVSWWLEGRPGHHDWTPFARYALQVEGVADPAAAEVKAREGLVRGKTTRLVQADVGKADPMGAEYRAQYPLVLSCYCVEAATADRQMWSRYMRNLSTLVAPGGELIVAAIRRSPSYKVGGRFFPSANIDEDDVRRVLALDFDAAATTVEVRELPEHSDQGFAGIVLAHAVKPLTPG